MYRNRTLSLTERFFNWVDDVRELPLDVWLIALLVCAAPFYEGFILSLFEWLGV